MSEKIFKYKIVSLGAGILGGLALVTGIGALAAATFYSSSDIGNVDGTWFVGPTIQVLLALLVIFGSSLMYKRHPIGKTLLIIITMISLVVVFVDAWLYFRESNDQIYLLSSLGMQAIPLLVLLFFVMGTSIPLKD